MIKVLRIEDSTRAPGDMNYAILDPSWDVVETAIRAMDGSTKSIVMLCLTDDYEVFMGIGGGEEEEGLRCCFIIDADGEEMTLLNSESNSTELVRFLMGEISTRPRNQLLDLSAIVAVAKSYFTHGHPDPSFPWIRRTWR